MVTATDESFTDIHAHWTKTIPDTHRNMKPPNKKTQLINMWLIVYILQNLGTCMLPTNPVKPETTPQNRLRYEVWQRNYKLQLIETKLLP